MKVLFYDTETQRPVLKRGDTAQEGILYADSFNDYANLGVSVFGFLEMNDRQIVGSGTLVNINDLTEFVQFANEAKHVVVGYNSYGFDDPLVNAHIQGTSIYTQFDVLRAIAANTDGSWKGRGLSPVCAANGIHRPPESAMAPVLYQTGQFAKLHQYVMNDVYATYEVCRLLHMNKLVDPVSGKVIKFYSDGSPLNPIFRSTEVMGDL